MSTLFKANGEVLEVRPINGKVYTLKELQGFVNGYIEVVRLRDDKEKFLVLNEEGLLQNLPYNKNASKKFGSFLVGDVVMIGCNEIE